MSGDCVLKNKNSTKGHRIPPKDTKRVNTGKPKFHLGTQSVEMISYCKYILKLCP